MAIECLVCIRHDEQNPRKCIEHQHLTYTHDSSSLCETKIVMCLLLVINCYKVVSGAWNMESRD